MATKLKMNPISHYNLDKPINKIKAPSIVSPNDKELRKALEARIERDIPPKLLEYNQNGHDPDYRYMKMPFTPTEIQKRMVWQMAAMGASQAIIRLAVINPETNKPVNDHTLMLNFGEIMKHAREQANFTVALKIYEIGIGHDAEYDHEGNLIRPYMPPNLDALKWWDRSRGEAKKLMDRSRMRDDESANTVTLVIEGS